MKKKLSSNLLPKKRLPPKPKYRWYFWDYLYYRGERARIQNGRYKMSGFVTLFIAFVQVWVLVIFLFGKYAHLSKLQLVSCAFITWFSFSVWYYIRYQKDRVKAMLIHYENNKWNERIPDMVLLFMLLALSAIGLYILNGDANM